MPTKITVIYDTPQEAAAFFPAVAGLATGGVRIVFADVEASGEPAAGRRFTALSGT